MANLLTMDLGGTKSRVGLSAVDGDGARFSIEAVYRNEEFASIAEVIAAFFKEYSVTATHACLAVAGVVEDDKARLTNLPWEISGKALRERFSFARVILLNDLTALAAMVPHLQGEEEVVLLKSGSAQAGETIGVIAPGTGLGQGYLVPAGDGYIIRGTEGGHSGFSPATGEELRLADWLMKKSSGTAVSAEQLGAGPGISVLYRYYEETSGIAPAQWVRDRVRQLDDLAPAVVAGAAAEKSCPLCTRVLEAYLAILGSETANLALKLYARGGIYIGGGVLLHLLGKVSLQPFVQAFTANARMSALLQSIPVYIITKEHANMHGALQYATSILQP